METGLEYDVYSNGVINERFRGRVTVVQSGDGVFELIISNVSQSDAGLYICEDLGHSTRYITKLLLTGELFHSVTTSDLTAMSWYCFQPSVSVSSLSYFSDLTRLSYSYHEHIYF